MQRLIWIWWETLLFLLQRAEIVRDYGYCLSDFRIYECWKCIFDVGIITSYLRCLRVFQFHLSTCLWIEVSRQLDFSHLIWFMFDTISVLSTLLININLAWMKFPNTIHSGVQWYNFLDPVSKFVRRKTGKKAFI